MRRTSWPLGPRYCSTCGPSPYGVIGRWTPSRVCPSSAATSWNRSPRPQVGLPPSVANNARGPSYSTLGSSPQRQPPCPTHITAPADNGARPQVGPSQLHRVVGCAQFAQEGADDRGLQGISPAPLLRLPRSPRLSPRRAEQCQRSALGLDRRVGVG